MAEKRFSTNGYYIYDHFQENKWLVNEVEAQEIVDKMNNLDTKARENSKALSTLQKKLNELNDENQELQMRYDAQRELYAQLNSDKNNLYEENKELHDFKQKVFDIIDEKIKELEYDLNRSVKAGMPTGMMYSEIDLLNRIKKELG